MILSLLECLTVSSPRAKLIVVRIIKSLVMIGIPMEVFQTAGEIILKNEDCASYRIIKNVKLHPDANGNEPFAKTAFLQFFYKFMVHIRSSMWSKTKIQSQGAYELSQEIAHFFMLIQSNTENGAA